MADRELQWNDEIQNDGGDFVLLPDGEYDFRVEGFKRARHEGSPKLPACNKAVLTLDVGNEEISSTMQENLFLHTKTEGLLCQFFRSIGARQSGEKMVMDWSKVVGATGRCKVTTRTFTKRDGTKGEANEVRFLDPDEGATAPAAETTDDMPF